ncbi:L-fucose:H+ symporter permease [Paraburkholderia phenoliruptrix]|uniref:L-fucose:H+ symporter permease n=1 Tax=Paraburkholderia phenoliruptrix TaxID=252970 RepID=UPI001C6ECDFF|nr:L-fucose:H+ symporter permease [Paraburkholderia phenoliruptrix]MBW9102695.1 L-fucose:H+ symporter permease [Paraburkholderia phenoliruptrix]MBW9128978.1 L-fucose:H+ symporter permease [Paraburkholderia ginsengiterrae]
MATSTSSTIADSAAATARDEAVRYRIALALVISLFFAWGLTYGLLDVLNKHFQQTLNVTRLQSALLQTCYFGAYFLVAVPSGLFVGRYGYKRGILLGLAIFALGALLFAPATSQHRFYPFLMALFVLACGAACLESAANSYVTVLGSPDGGARRLNLAQAFTGFGAFAGPLIGGLFFFRPGAEVANAAAAAASNVASVRTTYIVIATVILLLALAFWQVALPEPGRDARLPAADANEALPLRRERRFVFSVVAQFFYFSAQAGIAAFFINFATEHWPALPVSKAAFILSGAMIAFTGGRFLSTALMQRFDAAAMLATYAVASLVLCIAACVTSGPVPVIALTAVFFFESIMFPTIFALGIKGLGVRTGRAGSFHVMALVGGAVAPLVMGAIADRFTTNTAYWVPLVCFTVVLGFALSIRAADRRGSRCNWTSTLE